MPEPIGSPRWWLNRLLARLEVEQPQLEQLDRWYAGDHPLPHIPPDLDKRYFAAQFRELLRQSRANFLALVVDATTERMRVNGFRLSASDDRVADEESWRIWQANQMDAESQLAIREALTKRRSYLSVWAAEAPGGYPKIAVEDACQTIVEHEPGNRHRRAAALKVWLDDWTGRQRANVYLPDGIYKFEATTSDMLNRGEAPRAARVREVGGWSELEDEFVPNPLGVVPVIPIVNRPDLYGVGQSEIEPVIPIQERINGTIFNRLLVAWFDSFKQKVLTGVEVPTDPETGQPLEFPWKVAIDRLLVLENPDAKVLELAGSDMTPYLRAHERDIQDIAVITRTPRHYLFQEGQSPSGDAIKSAETGLVAKVRDKQRYMAEAFEEAIRLARQFAGEPDTPVDSEIEWADPEYRTEGELTDAVIKQYQAGLITIEMAQERLGYTPTQIARMGQQRVAEALSQRGVELAEQLLIGGTNPSSSPPVG